MGKVRTRKKRKKDDEGDKSDVETMSSESEVEVLDISKPYLVTDYKRRYPEDSGAAEFVVFVESSNAEMPIGTRDLMSISSCIKRFNKGVKYLRSMNKFKIAIYFEKASLANAFLNNSTFLKDYQFKANIPAQSTEITGIIKNVPTNLTNKKIFTMLSSYKKIISVRRFTKRTKIDNNFILQPLQTVAITFATSVLPDYVDLEGWRHDITAYVPPVKQCFRCLRYGHLAKFCKNSERCSICKEEHSFKVCTTPIEKAKCFHCDGNHVSISAQCPIKQKKIQENRQKVKPPSFADIFNHESFPPLGPKKPLDLLSLLKSNDKALNLLVQSIIKMITLNKTQDTPISSKNVLEVLNDICNPSDTKKISSNSQTN